MRKPTQLKKILILGISGTGKTRLARQLSERLKLPLTHYDTLVWREGWQERSEEEIKKELERVLEKEQWIIEGYVHPLAQEKLTQADQVLYLDYSGMEAFWGALQRWWQYRNRTRPEIAKGCIETWDWKFLKRIWNQEERPEIEKILQDFENKVTRLKNRKETQQFLLHFRSKVY